MLLVKITQPFEAIIALFIPKEYIFTGLPLLIIVLIIAPLIGFLTQGRFGRLIGKWVEKIPFLNMIFRKEKNIELVKKGIPAAIECQLANIKFYIYGFVTGTTKIKTKEEERITVSVYLPSIPIPLTSWIAVDVAIENVKEVKIPKNQNNVVAAIIQKKCLGFGQPLADAIELVDLKTNQVEQKLERETKSAE